MAGKSIIIKIEGDGASAQRALEMVREQLRQTGDQAKHEASEIGEAMERVKRALEMTGIYLGIREVIDGIKELVGGSLELGEQMEKAAKRTGLAVETLSTLHYAAAITGSDFDGLVGGIGKMENMIGKAADGSKKAAQFIGMLGLNAKDLASRTDGAEVAFHAFIERLAATESPIRRNELAMGLLGKAGSAQIPVLIEIAQHWDEFKAKAEAAGVMLTAETAKALAETNQRLNDLKQSFQGAGLAITEGMAPGLSQIFSIIAGGKSQLDDMNLLGQNLAKTFAFVGEVIYSAASAAEYLFAGSEGGRWTEAGRKDMAAAEELKRKAEAMHDVAFGKGAPKMNPVIGGLGEGAGGGRGFEGTDLAGEKKAKSDDPIVRAAAELVAEQAKAASSARKTADELALAELQTQHKVGIVADQEFYAEKLRLQDDMLDAEETSLRAHEASLQALYEKQKGDKLLKRGKDGTSAEELKTQKEMLQVQEQIDGVRSRRGSDSAANVTESTASERAAEIASLKVMAELEKERNAGITAQVALIRREKDEEAKKSTNAGGSESDAAAIRAAGELAVKKLQIQEITDDITRSENANKRAVQELQDAAAKDPRLKNAAAKEINALNKAEADQLRDLVRQYQALAQELGGPFLEKAKDLQEELNKLSTPDRREDAQFGKALAEGVESMASRMASAAMRGRESFSQMTQGILQDIGMLVLKLSMEKWLTPLLSGLIGPGSSVPQVPDAMYTQLEHHADGGTMNGPSIVGERGPELWSPPAKGGTVTPHETLTKLAQSGGGGGAPNIQMNLVNNSSQPVTAQPPQVSYDSNAKQFIIHTILEDHMQGGPTRALTSG